MLARPTPNANTRSPEYSGLSASTIASVPRARPSSGKRKPDRGSKALATAASMLASLPLVPLARVAPVELFHQQARRGKRFHGVHFGDEIDVASCEIGRRKRALGRRAPLAGARRGGRERRGGRASDEDGGACNQDDPARSGKRAWGKRVSLPACASSALIHGPPPVSRVPASLSGECGFGASRSLRLR